MLMIGVEEVLIDKRFP